MCNGYTYNTLYRTWKNAQKLNLGSALNWGACLHAGVF